MKPIEPRLWASHLYGNARCFRPDHLVVEGDGVSERRKHCVSGRASTICPTHVSICRAGDLKGGSNLVLVSSDGCGR